MKTLVGNSQSVTSKTLKIYTQHSYKLETYPNNLSMRRTYEDNRTEVSSNSILSSNLQTTISEKESITFTVEQPVNTPLPNTSSTEPESTDTQRRLAESKPRKSLTMDLCYCIKSIDCGRDRKLIWRITSFSFIIDNPKAAEKERQKGIHSHTKIPCNVHSPAFYTSTPGYRFDMKLYP